MAETTGIAWTHSTFNPIRGCQHAQADADGGTETAPECDNCYAATMSKRNPKVLGEWGAEGTRVVAAEPYWGLPEKWDKVAAAASERQRVFCASLADVFEDWPHECLDHQGNAHFTSDADPARMVNGHIAAGCLIDDYHYTHLDDVRRRLFGVIDGTPNLDWLLLTKRPENVRQMWPTVENWTIRKPGEAGHRNEINYRGNCWLGTSCGHPRSEWRIAELLKCRDLAPVLFLSVEPMLGLVDLRLGDNMDDDEDSGVGCVPCNVGGRRHQHYIGEPCGRGIDWVIIGCESNGPRVGRLGEFESEAAWWDACADVVRQCREAGVAVFCKQGPLHGRVAHDLEQFPAECRVREFPEREAVSA